MRDESQLVLDAIAGRRPNMRGRVRANCPFCETVVHKVDRKQCLSLTLHSGYWKCYRCASDGRLGQDEIPYDTSTMTPPDKEEKPPVNLPEGFVRLSSAEGQALVCQPAWRYLRKERTPPVPDSIIDEARVGACVRGRYVGRVVVPIYKAGKLVGYMTRVWKKKPPKNVRVYLYSDGFERESVLYNEEALYVTTDEPVIVVEGIFDTFPFYPNAVAVLGKPSPSQLEMLVKARRPILIVFDGDAHREATALAMTLRLHGKTAAALRLPPGVDPDECCAHVKAKAQEVFRAA